jgi:hypothetical protein
LRPTEYRLLYHLIENAGWTVPHDQLLVKVWGYEYRDEAHYVRLYVNYLREKIEEADETYRMTDESGRETEVHIWHKLYFLERQLKGVTNERLKQKLRHMPLKVIAIYDPDYDEPLLVGTPLLALKPEAAYKIYVARWPVEGVPQAGKYILSGGTGTHYVHHPTAMERLPVLSLIFGSLLKYAAATLPPFRTGFWDRAIKPTYGRLLRQLKKVGIPLSGQLFKKESVTSHLPLGYDAIRLAKA